MLRLLAAVLLGSLLPALAAAPLSEEPDPSFPVRIVALGGDLDSPAVREHLEFSFNLGFNAVWVPSTQAGSWEAARAAEGPLLDPGFVEWAREVGDRGVRIFVVLDPVVETSGGLVVNDDDGVRRIRKFFRLLGRQAGVRDVVLSYQGAPLQLTELQDTLRYGPSSAPVHVDLAAMMQGKLGRKQRLWLAPAIASTRGLADESIPYSASLAASLPELDPRVGLVWNGPAPVSPQVGPADLEDLRAVVGRRPILFCDRYPAGLGVDRLTLALALSPLRRRAPGLRHELAGYLVLPMKELGGSRFALRTAAAFLTRPGAYNADAAWEESILALAGENPRAREALKTQAMAWGGWIGERNYRSPLLDNPATAAEILGDPAAVASWSWVESRYPERMRDLAGLADEPFRSDLAAVMSSRLTVARALPVSRELRRRLAAGRGDVEPLIAQLRALRARAAAQPRSAAALDRFLVAAGLADLVIVAP